MMGKEHPLRVYVTEWRVQPDSFTTGCIMYTQAFREWNACPAQSPSDHTSTTRWIHSTGTEERTPITCECV
ncbi:hypothetical protein AG1IA_03741 [Rhizoctonia solani AG-1 IA]|uniref:Uncharacterized protein n=1 Tax=Thanatephorus cucumeris (strain AG1-IA) TaxID=983506 RepID=L8X0S9_THACA|nr:hypothetical protein AG1IA_03741 [Rhizoctonia solani AG-1 IA]